MDLFLAYAYHDEEYASGLEDTLAGRGRVVVRPGFQRPEHLPSPPLRVVLRQLPLALQPVDLDAEPHDRFQQALDMRLRLVEGPGLVPWGLVGRDRPPQDVQELLSVVDE